MDPQSTGSVVENDGLKLLRDRSRNLTLVRPQMRRREVADLRVGELLLHSALDGGDAVSVLDVDEPPRAIKSERPNLPVIAPASRDRTQPHEVALRPVPGDLLDELLERHPQRSSVLSEWVSGPVPALERSEDLPE